MKKVYTTPVATEEKFEANEYVAACWGVGCNVDAANKYTVSKGLPITGDNNVSHSSDHCGLSTNQVVKTDASGTATGMTECHTDGLGDLSCTVYTDSTYTQTMSYSSIEPGMTIYWTTSASNNRTWYHQGTVYETYTGHPNRS